MRKLLIAFGIVLAVIVGSVFWVFSSADEALHEAIETRGTAALGVAVALERASIDLIAGRITLTGLTVDNPAGYGVGPAIEAGEIDILMAPEEGKGQTLVLSRIVAKAPLVRFQRGDGSSNLAVLLANAVDHAATPAGRGEAPKTPQDGLAVPPSPRLIVRDLYVRDSRLVVVADPAEGGERPLDDIHLTGLGGDRGRPAGMLLEPVLDALLDAARRAAAAG